MGKLDSLVAKAGEVTVQLDRRALSEAADLVLRLMQAQTREVGGLLPPAMARSFMERSENEREGMRSAVLQVVVALALLGYIEPSEL